MALDAHHVRLFGCGSAPMKVMVVADTHLFRDDVQREKLEAACRGETGGLPLDWVRGGEERQDSVARALGAQPEDCRFVFIHDCARPLVSARALAALGRAVHRDRAAVLAHPVKDTVKRVPLGLDLRRTRLEDLDRGRLWAMETPQAFAFDLVSRAYAEVARIGAHVTDDTAALALLEEPVTIVPNPDPNPKITAPEDLLLVESLLGGK
jgi:2-C-methyl-D-erythritol 4-phosphate cytidylyltransferase